LGTSLNPNYLTLDCDFYSLIAYRLGYGFTGSTTPDPKYLYYGTYVTDPDVGGCLRPTTAPPAFSPRNPQGALDVEIFDSSRGAGHLVYGNGTMLSSDTFVDVIQSLPDGWIGRAYQSFTESGVPRHSRFKGDIAEIVIYNDKLSTTDVQAVSDYL